MLNKPLLLTAALILGACTGSNKDSSTSFSTSASDLGPKITADKSIEIKNEDTFLSALKLTLATKNPCLIGSNARNEERIIHKVETDLVGDSKRTVTPEERKGQTIAFKDSMKSILSDKWATKVCEALFKVKTEEVYVEDIEDSEDIRNRDAIGALTGSIAKLKFNDSSKLKLEYSPTEGETAIIYSKDI